MYCGNLCICVHLCGSTFGQYCENSAFNDLCMHEHQFTVYLKLMTTLLLLFLESTYLCMCVCVRACTGVCIGEHNLLY